MATPVGGASLSLLERRNTNLRAPTIDAINIELNEKDRHQQLQASIRRLSPDGINDSRVAEQYGLFFSTLNNLPAQIRSTRLSAEVKETGSDDSALRQQEQMALKAIEDNGRVRSSAWLLGEKENQLAMFILMAQLATPEETSIAPDRNSKPVSPWLRKRDSGNPLRSSC
jgi:hypothetical protein